MNSKSAFISDFDKEQNNRKPLLLNQIGSDKGVPCTFAEINDLTYQINLKNLNMDQSKYALDRESQESRTGNCMCYKEENTLLIVSQGGSQFTLPLEQEVSAVYPLNEGLLIEFHVRHELKMTDILSLSKKIKGSDEVDFSYEEKNLYSYVTLNRHPLNPLKVLGIFRKNDETTTPWFRSQERIVYVSDKIPLLISYNIVLQRHAMHYIRLNVQERDRNDNQLQFQNNFYTLHNTFMENPGILGFSYLLADRFYEDSNKEDSPKKCELIKGSTFSEILILMLIEKPSSYVKIYSLDILNHNFDKIISVNSLRKITSIDGVRNFFAFNLFSDSPSMPKCIDLEKKMFKGFLNKFESIKMLVKKNSKLQQNVVLFHSDGHFSLYQGVAKLFDYNIPFHNGLTESILSFHPSSMLPISQRIKDICNFKNGHAQVILDDNRRLDVELCPKINNKLISIILKCLSSFIQEKFFHKMLTDIIINCFSHGQFENIHLLGEETRRNNYSEFQNLVSYFVFILKLCCKNGISQSDETENADEEFPTKKVKVSVDVSSKDDSARKEAVSATRTPFENNERTPTNNWRGLCQSNFHLKSGSNVDKLFKKRGVCSSEAITPSTINMLNQFSLRSDKSPPNKSPDVQDASNTALPRITISLQDFYHRRIKILRILHLLYQELKLIKTSHNYLEDLSYLLYCYSKYLDHYYSSYYCDYYIRENPKILDRFANDAPLKQLVQALKTKDPLSQQSARYATQRPEYIDNSFSENSLYILEREPPDIIKWIQEKLLLKQKDIQSSKMNIQPFLVMPIAFQTTKFACKIFEMITINPQTRHANDPSSASNQTNSSRLSDLLNRNFSKNVQEFLGNHDILTKIEYMYPLYHQSIGSSLPNDEERFRSSYRLLRESIGSVEEQVFIYLIKKRVALSEIQKFALGLSVPIHEILHNTRIKIPAVLHQKLPKLAFKLIGRDDLYRNSKIYTHEEPLSESQLSAQLNSFSLKSNYTSNDEQSKDTTKSNKTHLFHNFSATINKLITGGSQKIVPEALLHQNSSVQGQSGSLTQEGAKLQSNHELLLREVSKLLDTTQTMRIKAKHLESIPEDKWDAESQNILHKICCRRFSVLVGRGALSFGTLHTLITETLKIPKINLSAYTPPSDTRITLEIKEPTEKDIPINTWPDFHNGVATGLNLYKDIMQYDTNQLRTWIFYQRPEVPKNEHGGYLFGLGMLGFLDSFLPTDIYQYLRPGHDATSVGILLGLAASRIGKMDENTSKTLCLHIPNLIPPTYDIEISINVQTAAIVGIGLLHKGTCNRVMTEMTLSQIGRKPISDKSLDRDGYSLASGYALGLINLGKGTRAPSIKDLDLDARLIRFVEGGKIMEPPKSMLSSTYNMDNQKCSSVREGKTVNTHITAPAALVALALIYLRSNDKEVANKITIPNSFSSIEFANPNHILLKTVAKNLIMWDEISNTKEYIYAQIPDLIRFIFEKPLKDVCNKFELIYNVEEIDFHTVCLIYTNIIAGCVMSIGLRYAGTGDKQACKTIVEEINFFRKLKVAKCDLANDRHNKNSIDNYSLCTFLSVCILAMSLIMAGTCDQECLKLFKSIKRRVEEASNMHYGFSMAIHMAIGFLFLGNGSHSFGNSDLAIASLLISIFPHFPSSTNDNKYHLQALRHFYVLASEARLFHAIDVDTNRAVSVNLLLEIETEEGRVEERCQTPHLIQMSKKVLSLKLLDDKYYDLLVKFKNREIPRERLVYVKRRYPLEVDVDHCKDWFKNDKKSNDIMLKTETQRLKASDLALKSILSFSDNAEAFLKREMMIFNDYKLSMGLFSKYFDKLAAKYERLSENLAHNGKSVEELKSMLIESYFELLCEDRLEFFPFYQQLVVIQNLHGVFETCYLQNLNVIMRFYEAKERIFGKSQTAIFNPIHLAKIKAKYIEQINKEAQIETNVALGDYFNKLELTISSQTSTRYLRQAERALRYCTFNNIPLVNDLDLIKKSVVNCKKLKASTDSKDLSSTSEEKHKKMLQACQLYLYLSFPLCPQDVLESITNHYFA